MPRLSVPLTDDQHAAIRRKAGALGVPQAEVARRLLLAWARGEVEMPITGYESDTVKEARARLAERERLYPPHDFICQCGASLHFPSAIDGITCPNCGGTHIREVHHVPVLD